MKNLPLVILWSVCAIAGAQTPRDLPKITCDNGSEGLACASLKQLVEARDSGILFALMGSPDESGRHVAYACFSSEVDSFSVIEYTAPNANSFEAPFTPQDAGLKRRLFSGPLPGIDKLSAAIIDRWFAGHSKSMLYAIGGINLLAYQNGFLTGMNTAFGEWARPANSPLDALPNSVGYAAFTGNVFWINHIASSHVLLPLTDTMMTEAFANAAELYVHYQFTNKAHNLADDTIQVQRSTGRFIETIKVSGHEYDDQGACKMFRY